MRANIYFLILLLAVLDCSDGKQKGLPEREIDDFHSYKIDMDMSQTKLVDLIDTLEVMRLEETAESLLGYVHGLQEFPGGFFISGKTGILFFNNEGEFMHKFDHKGIGPDQYADIYDYWTEGDTIAVFSRGSQHIKRYDFNGNFVSSFRLPFYTQHVYPTEKGFVYDLNYGIIKDSLKYRVLIVNTEHELVKRLLPFDVFPKMYYTSQFPSIKPYGNTLTYLGLMSDSLYQVADDTIRPLIHFDFGEKWYWNEETKMIPKMYSASQGEKVDNIDTHIGSNYIWLNARYIMSDMQPFLINRLKGAMVSIDLRNQRDGRHTISPIKWGGDKLLMSIQSNDFSALLKELDESKIHFRQGTTLVEIESSENPVLMWVKFKGI